MQIVIDIPNRIYKIIQNKTLNIMDAEILEKAVKNGVPLPKGHGDLKDADGLEELFGKKCVGDCGACMTKRKTDGRGRWYDTCSLIETAQTIIEADKSAIEDAIIEEAEEYEADLDN